MAAPNNSWQQDSAPFRPVGAHDAPAIDSAATLTPPATADKLLAQAIDGDVRFTLDGTVPTASLGFQLRDGDAPLLIHVSGGVVVKAIEEDDGASLQIQWGN